MPALYVELVFGGVAALILWPLDSWFIVRLGRAYKDPHPWFGWIPGVRTIIVARASGVGWLSWILSGVPVIGAYVNWDWWEEILVDLKIRRSGLRALGIVFVPFLRTYLIYRTAAAAEARARGTRAVVSLTAVPATSAPN